MDDLLAEVARPVFAGRWITEASEMAPFLTDWRSRWTGRALAIAQPDTPEDVAKIVQWCHRYDVAIVPQGGNTGLSGGAVPDTAGRTIVISLTRMARVKSVDPINNTMVVEAGCTLQQVQEAARAHGRLFPLSLAAEGTCIIGGNLATNAGGVQVLRYGNTRDLCLGVEVVTADGQIWNGLRGLRKDNTGYDLRDLFIGSEGTLGIMTSAVLKLYPLPAAQLVSFVSVATPEDAIRLVQLAQQHAGSSLTAVELLSETCLELVMRHMPGMRRPVKVSPWYVLLEISDARSEEGAAETMESLLEQAMEARIVIDAALSSSLAQFEALWALRENISESQGAEGKTIKHDIALPISALGDFINKTSALIERTYPTLRLVVFGHLGDGNLHYNISPPDGTTGEEANAEFLALEGPLNLLVHDEVARRGGSISAEHGLGVLRRDESIRYKSPIEVQLMLAIKQALDPKALMNPGKLLC